MLTGKKPNLSRMRVFGSVCCTYKHDKKNLDSRCEKGVFIGYDKYSPAYLVYYPGNKKVSKHRLVRFVTKNVVEKETQTDPMIDDDLMEKRYVSPRLTESVTAQNQGSVNVSQETFDWPDSTDTAQIERNDPRYPKRDRRTPQYLSEYVTDVKSNDQVSINIDYCYRMCDAPQNIQRSYERT